jgi:transposase
MAWTAGTRGDYVRPGGTYASDVTDREWALIAPLLPAARRGGRPRSTCLRRVVNAVFYLLQTGCQWRMLPRDFPPRSTVYGYFRAWIGAGVWAHVHDALYRRTRELEGRDESPTAAIIDSQSVKTGAEAHEMVGFDAGKRIKGRKRHLVTDTLGLMLRIEVHSAGMQDRDGAALAMVLEPMADNGSLLDRITRRFPFIERFFADAGYRGPRVADAAPRPVEIIKRTDSGFVVQPKRWVIERTFAWACINRRLARDVERAAATAQALFQIAMIKLMSRRIARLRDF